MSECACTETDVICADHRHFHGLRPLAAVGPTETIHIAGAAGGMAACGAPAVGGWRATIVAAATCRACLTHFGLAWRDGGQPR